MDERGSVREMHEGLVCVDPVFIPCSSRHPPAAGRGGDLHPPLSLHTSLTRIFHHVAGRQGTCVVYVCVEWNGERRAPYLPNSPDKFEIPVQYRPETLDAFETINASTAQTLKAVVRSGDCPHTLFYGPTGAGTYLSSISNVDLCVLTPPTPNHLVCPLVGPDAPRCPLGD